MAGEDLNYYYLGHLMAAGLVKLSGVAPDVGYNLAVAAFFAFSVVAAFGLAVALVARVGGGLWGVALCVLAGTIGSGLELVERRRAAAQLRLVRRLARDRGHDQRVPRLLVHARRSARARDGDPVLAAGARASGCSSRWPGRPPPPRGPAALELGVAAIAIGTLYAINAWSFPVIAGLVLLGALVRVRRRAQRARAHPDARLGARRAAARGPRRAALPAHLRRRRRRAGPRHRARVVGHAGRATTARSTGCSPTSSRRPTRCGSRARGIRGAPRAGRRRPRSSSARCWPRRTSSRSAACVVLVGTAAHAALRRPRAGRRALRLGADRRRAAVPADPGGRLRQGLLRRQRPLPHEHGLQARLPGVAAARDRGLRRDRVELDVAGPARAARAVRVGAAAAGRPRARRRLPGGGHLRPQGRLLAGAPPRRAALAGGGGARRPAGDRVAARPRAARSGRARVRRRRLLGLRPRRASRPSPGGRR